MTRKPPPYRRKRDPLNKAQLAPRVIQPGPSPLAEEMQQKQKEETVMPQLFAVHVQGPDDVIAATDRAEADRRAAEINAAYDEFAKRPDASDLDARWHAVVIEWPYEPEEHAQEVARGNERWEP